MRILIVTILAVLFSPLGVSDQTKTFKWENGLCGYEGSYDSTKYSESQLKDTVKLVTFTGEFDIGTDAVFFRLEDVEKRSLEKLEKEYAEISKALKNLSIVPVKYWEEERQRKLKELRQVYQLSKTSILSYESPGVLKKYPYASSCVEKYADPLISGGDKLLDIWEEVNKASRKNNADPGRLKRRFEEQKKSANKYKYAQMEVMTFGWWNCANKFVERVGEGSERSDNFKKLFKNVKEECDEP